MSDNQLAALLLSGLPTLAQQPPSGEASNLLLQLLGSQATATPPATNLQPVVQMNNAAPLAASSMNSLAQLLSPAPASASALGAQQTTDPAGMLLQLLTGTGGSTSPMIARQESPPPLAASSTAQLNQSLLQLLSQSPGGANLTALLGQQQPGQPVQQRNPLIAALAPLPTTAVTRPPQQVQTLQAPGQNELMALLCQLLASQKQCQQPGRPLAQAQSQPTPQQVQSGGNTASTLALLQLLTTTQNSNTRAVVSDCSVTSSSCCSSGAAGSRASTEGGSTGSAARARGEVPGPHDVLLGRGSGISNHIGNIKFRKLVDQHKERYVAASRTDKPKVAGELVAIWRKMTPPGRFLVRPNESNQSSAWKDVGDHRARQKTSQCLREREREPQKEQERKRKRIANL